MRFVVDAGNVHPEIWAHEIELATIVGTKRVAGRLRDQMRKAFDASIHQTEYGNYAPNESTLRNFIVVNDTLSEVGVFSVGAMRNRSIGNSTIDEIFYYMDQGTGHGDSWVFALPPSRANNSDSGYWVTSGQKGKGFITQTAEKYASSQFYADAAMFVMPDIEIALASHIKI